MKIIGDFESARAVVLVVFIGKAKHEITFMPSRPVVDVYEYGCFRKTREVHATHSVAACQRDAESHATRFLANPPKWVETDKGELIDVSRALKIEKTYRDVMLVPKTFYSDFNPHEMTY
jgi:hypothetical protein